MTLRLDGDAPPVVGQSLDRIGVRTWCSTVTAAHDAPQDAVVPEGADQAAPSAPSAPSARYRVTGVASAGRDYMAGVGQEAVHAGSEWVLTVRTGEGALSLLGCSALTAAAAPTGRVNAVGVLSVISDYEWDAFGLPEVVRATWTVVGLVDVDGQSVLLNLDGPHGVVGTEAQREFSGSRTPRPARTLALVTQVRSRRPGRCSCRR